MSDEREPITIFLCGRKGTGKSTISRKLQECLELCDTPTVAVEVADALKRECHWMTSQLCPDAEISLADFYDPTEKECVRLDLGRYRTLREMMQGVAARYRNRYGDDVWSRLTQVAIRDSPNYSSKSWVIVVGRDEGRYFPGAFVVRLTRSDAQPLDHPSENVVDNVDANLEVANEGNVEHTVNAILMGVINR